MLLAVPEAVMVAIPPALPVAMPVMMVAMLGSLLVQLRAALLVISNELPSDKIAVATNARSNPTGTDAVTGVICNEVTTALVTVSSAVALKRARLVVPDAVIVTLPEVMPVAKPLWLPIVAIVGSLLLQLSAALLVISSELPSDKIAVAIKDCSNPTGTDAVAGLICNEVTVVPVTVNWAVELN